MKMLKTLGGAMRRRLGFILAVCVLAGCSGADPMHSAADHTPETAEQKKLNVLFILSDDQAPDTIAALGNDRIATPNLDRLARQGMSFTQVFNQGSWSGAVCAPSRRMINTGRYLYHTGMGPGDDKSGRDAADFTTFGETFKDAGYNTFMSGKWHLPMPVFERSFTHGKAVFPGGMNPIKDGGQWTAEFVDYDATAEGEAKFTGYRADKHTSEMIADAAVDFLHSGTADDKPFMMYVAFLAPHDPRQSPDEFVNRYRADSIDLPLNYAPEHPFNQGDHYIRDEILTHFPRDPEVIKGFIGEYYAMIEHMDSQVGRILDALDASGQADNTIIIFTSDHGLAAGKHGLLGKQNMYDHSVKAPFIIKGPGVPKNKSKPGMFYISSAFPTAAELAGLAVPASVQVKSAAPLVRGESRVLYKDIYSSYRHFQRMVRDEDWKLIYYPMIKKTQLFNIKNDPLERENLAADLSHQDRILAMMARLEDWKRIVNDPLDNDDVLGSFKGRGAVNDLDHRARDWKDFKASE